MLIICTLSACAQGDFWRRAHGPYGGTAFSLQRDSSGRVIAGTNDGVFASSDGGHTWSLLGFEGHIIERLIVTPAGTIGVAARINDRDSRPKGCYRSTDGGRSWSPWTVPFQFSWGDIAGSLLASDSDGHIYATSESTLLRSDDEGVTWRTLGAAPKNARFVLQPDAIVALHGDSIYTSTDHGERWSHVAERPGWLIHGPPGTLYRFFIDGASPRLERSNDGGAQWKDVGGTAPTVGSLSPPFYNKGCLFAIWHNDTDRRYWDYLPIRSRDEGATWTPLGSISTDFFYLVPTHNGDLLAGTVHGLIRSSDNGESWRVSSYGLGSVEINHMWESSSSILTVSSRENNYYSLDSGLSWVTTPFPRAHIAAGRDGVIVASTDEGTYRSTDRGVSWMMVTETRHTGYLTSSPDGVVRILSENAYYLAADGWKIDSSFIAPMWKEMLALIAYTGRALYATGQKELNDEGRYEAGVLYRTTNGRVWKKVYDARSMNGTTEVPGIIAENEKDIYLVASDGTIRHSNSMGARWRTLDYLPAEERIMALAIAPNGILHVATDKGIYRLEKSGRTGSALPPLPNGLYASRMVILPHGRILAGTSQGVFIGHTESSRDRR